MSTRMCLVSIWPSMRNIMWQRSLLSLRHLRRLFNNLERGEQGFDLLVLHHAADKWTVRDWDDHLAAAAFVPVPPVRRRGLDALLLQCPIRRTGFHCPQRNAPAKEGGDNRRACAWCKHRTVYSCATCNLPLCVSDADTVEQSCYYMYHTAPNA